MRNAKLHPARRPPITRTLGTGTMWLLARGTARLLCGVRGAASCPCPCFSC